MTDNNFKSIVIFQRPGELNHVGKWVLNDIIEFSKCFDVPISFSNDGYTITAETLFVAIGGDGTMLHAMDESLKFNTDIQRNVTSVVGFNAGNLGFLTEDPSMYKPSWLIKQIFEDSDYVKCEERMALSANIAGQEHFAINEFTFTPKSISAPLKYEININGRIVADHMGSGCMVATATGSTAMSMSAGGAIINPSTNVMQIVPIIPHTLTSRPVITSGTDIVTITSDVERTDAVIISSDGRELYSFSEDAAISITKAEFPVRVWYAKKRDFFNVLSTKLKW